MAGVQIHRFCASRLIAAGGVAQRAVVQCRLVTALIGALGVQQVASRVRVLAVA
jgi:hypothetical protein